MYYRKRRNKMRFFPFFFLLLFVASLTYGYFNNKDTMKKPEDVEKIDNIVAEEVGEKKETDDVVNEAIESSLESNELVDSNENLSINLVGEDTEIIFNTYYKNTGDILTDRTNVPAALIGVTLEEFKDYIEEYYNDWSIRSISTDGVVLYREREGYVPNQYIVQEKDGYIVVYRINEKGEKVLHYETDISLSVLNEIDRQKLKEGIIVKNFEEALMIIQDYSS